MKRTRANQKTFRLSSCELRNSRPATLAIRLWTQPSNVRPLSVESVAEQKNAGLVVTHFPNGRVKLRGECKRRNCAARQRRSNESASAPSHYRSIFQTTVPGPRNFTRRTGTES